MPTTATARPGRCGSCRTWRPGEVALGEGDSTFRSPPPRPRSPRPPRRPSSSGSPRRSSSTRRRWCAARSTRWRSPSARGRPRGRSQRPSRTLCPAPALESRRISLPVTHSRRPGTSLVGALNLSRCAALARPTTTPSTTRSTRPRPRATSPGPTSPARPTPKRKPLTDSARDAGWDLRKAAERLQRIADDDRFDGHKEQVAPHLRSHLTNAIEVCQELLARINN